MRTVCTWTSRAADSGTPFLTPSFALVDSYFLYDATAGGVITRSSWSDPAADFGNADYNDHHYHYGYLLSAASLLRPYLSSNRWDRFLDSLASDVCNNKPGKWYPITRHFDFYQGHSWASGLQVQVRFAR